MCPPVRFTIYRRSLSEKARIANRVIVATEWTLRDSFGHRFSQQQMIRLVNKQRPGGSRSWPCRTP
jgi:hypothetical protein